MKKRKPPVLLISAVVILGAVMFIFSSPFSPAGQVPVKDAPPPPPAANNGPATSAPRTAEAAGDIKKDLKSGMTAPAPNIATTADGDLQVPSSKAAEMSRPPVAKVGNAKPDPNRVSSFGLTGK